MKRYIFYLESRPYPGSKPVQVRMLYEMRCPLLEGAEYSHSLLSILPPNDPLVDAVQQDQAMMKNMDFSARFNMADGPYMVSIDLDESGWLTNQMLEDILIAKKQSGKLDEFLKGARC